MIAVLGSYYGFLLSIGWGWLWVWLIVQVFSSGLINLMAHVWGAPPAQRLIRLQVLHAAMLFTGLVVLAWMLPLILLILAVGIGLCAFFLLEQVAGARR